jgi:D-ribulokinase
MQQAFIGVDVGTASARAGIFDARGTLLATARHPIAIWREPGDIVEQSSDDIWSACASTIRACLRDAALALDAIAGLGFDATGSMAVLDAAGRPITVSPSGDANRNIIVWMDHRATAEARFINATQHEVLAYVGNAISPEMEMAKLVWLKRHLPKTYAGAGHFMDLADFLTFRATGSVVRSMCTVTCKWAYLAHERRWSASYQERIGLGDLAQDGYRRIGNEFAVPGAAIAPGLSAAAARELGLNVGTPVAAALIDAHAGGVGTIGARCGQGDVADVTRRLAYIMGTSACIMATTREARFVPGVWGPSFSAMVPGYWLCEGGQSAAGAAIDQLMRSHPAYPEAASAAQSCGSTLLDYLEQRVVTDAGPGEAALLARGIHVLPEFLGNRSPYADPEMRAIVAGLGLDDDVASLGRLFVAGLCGLAYGLADVVDAMRAHGIESETMVISGGASRSRLVRQIMADTTGLSVVLPQTAEPVLLGAAMLGAVAGGAFASIPEAMGAMSEMGAVTGPTPPALAAFHAAKRRVHALMRGLDADARALMAAPAAR